MKIHKDDMVLIIAGKDRGKKGKVRFAYPRKDQVIVEGFNMIKKHSKARGAARQAGIIDLEAPIHVSNIMLLCSKCNKPGRIGMKTLEDGRRVRFCRACREVVE
jgi:large subunit ribosomal protein L24